MYFNNYFKKILKKILDRFIKYYKSQNNYPDYTQIILDLDNKIHLLDLKSEINLVSTKKSIENILYNLHNEIAASSLNLRSQKEWNNEGVSFIIPTHNNPATLWDRTIPSILSQDEFNFDIIIVLDKYSNDKINLKSDIENKLSKNLNKKIKLVVNYNLNRSYTLENIKLENSISEEKNNWLNSGTSSFIFGINASNKKYCVPFAHDDEINNKKGFKKLYEHLVKNDLDIIFGQLKQISPDNLNNKIFTNYPLKIDNYGIQGSIMKSELAINLFKEYDSYFNVANDWGVIERILKTTSKIGYSDIIVTNYYPSSLWK